MPSPMERAPPRAHPLASRSMGERMSGGRAQAHAALKVGRLVKQLGSLRGGWQEGGDHERQGMVSLRF